jgi:N-sulfoglucosamine sulfohydrolase
LLLAIFSCSLFVSGNPNEINGGPPAKPNILLIMGDDLTFRDIKPYGNDQVKTPNIARLAREGKCLDNMFTSTAMCSPTRQQLLTGMYPVRNGAYPNHSRVYPGIKSVAHHMQTLGYNAALIGKRHFAPESAFPFQYLGGRDHDDGEGQDIDLKLAENFIMNSKDKPYFLMVTSNQPHTPWNRGNRKAYASENLKLPPYFVDTEETRKQISQYYAEITYLDSLVGVCLDMVEKSGGKNNTIVIFTSEQGSSAPFGKWTCYDNGLKTAFIARWPGKIKAGSRTSAMTQYVDIVPTLIEMAGSDPATFKTGRKDANGNAGFDGKSFVKVLTGETDKFRDYVFGVQTTRGIFRGSECYPIRSARSNKYLYIHNLSAENNFENTVLNSPLYKSWSKTGKKEDLQRAQAYIKRPEEELYDVEKDPYQLVNLAGQASLRSVQEDLKEQLAGWMKQQGDHGIETEMQALDRQPKKEPKNNTPVKSGKKKKKSG